ncbi:phytoene/squalene synthase family protein [Anaeromyxobacter sp. Fw109-5]|uniref:phytoene/squalene synthase family protein n=1 Tax=Anaeromyxobacter sp. (strain Fw109-5) TaxID=404589 RepID=UPI00059BF63C|nr:phytoene/squalene synthase family protein [Anaeromyxobacter sp. Fw109-5]
MTMPASEQPSAAQLVHTGLAECWEILRVHGKTFHMMAKLLGPERGNDIAALYGFARVADDAVDVPAPGDTPDDIRAKLARMQAELRRAVRGESAQPRFVALGETVRRHAIPLEPFDDLVAGLLMDLEGARYRTFADLELYCYRVAGTVGLMITPVAGYREGTEALEHAKTLGTAMQLTNILRDVGEDLNLGRVYLPEEDLALFGLADGHLAARRVDGRFKALMDFEIARARGLYERGLALIPLLADGRGRLAFQFAVDAYSAILEKIRANRYDVFRRRASLSASEKLALVPGALWRASLAATNGHAQ